MALPLGKLTIIIGAGLLGSILAKEGRISTVSDLFSGTFKIALKHLQKNDSPSTTSKPRNDSLLAQVNSLREELQMLASSRSVTIVTGGKSARSGTYVPVIVVVGIAGYGYIWWKGWKLSDMMFATRKSLSDARISVGKQLEQLSSTIGAAKRHLSSRIDRLDNNLDQCVQINVATRDEVTQLRGDLREFGVDVESVHRAVQTLENKIGRIEGKQDLTNQGVYRLCTFVQKLEQGKTPELMGASPSPSSRPLLELPQISTSKNDTSSTTIPQLDPPPPSSSDVSLKVPRHAQTISFSGLKELQGISRIIDDPNSSGVNPSPNEPKSSGSSGSGRFGWKLPSFQAPFLARSNSTT